MKGSMGKYLMIDLNTATSHEKVLERGINELFIGGKGVGAYLLYQLLAPGIDPLGPENVLIFMTGPLTATRAPAMRSCVVSKSPLTGTFVDSYFGGYFGQEIKYAGYDGLIITGQASEPVYIWLDNGNVEIRPAKHLWGKDTFATAAELKDELRDQTVKVACIGSAGENLVKFALISCEYNRQAGRGGTGAVMGSKGLKAIAVRGSQLVTVARPLQFQAAVEKAYQELLEDESIKAFTIDGTVGSIPFANDCNLLPTKNYFAGQFEGAGKLGPEAQRQQLWYRDVACAGCTIRCSKIGKVQSGRHSGLVSDVVEYENVAMMGSNLGIDDIREIAYLVKKCDALGLDGMSAGGVIGFAMESWERGLLTDKDYPEGFSFGNARAADYLLEAISKRTGIGDILADGVRLAAAKLQCEDFAVHVKGLESPAWGPRGTPGMGLALATADRGGCHQRAFPILYETGGIWKDKPVERLGVEYKAEIVAHLQNYLAGLDSLIKCDFGQYGIKAQTYLSMLEAATGLQMTEDELLSLGERTWNLIRLFNCREGFSRKDDKLPRRFSAEGLPSGPFRGSKIDNEMMRQMLDEYYQIRNWDQQGKPTEEKIQSLKLDFLM